VLSRVKSKLAFASRVTPKVKETTPLVLAGLLEAPFSVYAIAIGLDSASDAHKFVYYLDGWDGNVYIYASQY
jgi:hypothetical protein